MYMGAFLKYILPISMLGLCLVVFQNCGNTLHGNGDPYENGDITVDPIIDIPDPSHNQNIPPIPNFTVQLTCRPATPGHIHQINFGTQHGKDAILIQTAEGLIKTFEWTSESTTQVINSFIGTKLEVFHVTLNVNQATIEMRLKNTTNVTESLSCQ